MGVTEAGRKVRQSGQPGLKGPWQRLRERPSKRHCVVLPTYHLQRAFSCHPRDTVSGCKGRTSDATSHDSAQNACDPVAGVAVASLKGVNILARTLGLADRQDPCRVTAREGNSQGGGWHWSPVLSSLTPASRCYHLPPLLHLLSACCMLRTMQGCVG